MAGKNAGEEGNHPMASKGKKIDKKINMKKKVESSVLAASQFF